MSSNEIDPSDRCASKVRDRLVAALANGPLTRLEWQQAAKCDIRALDRHYGYLELMGVVVQQELVERIQLSKTRWTQKSYTLYCLAAQAAPEDYKVVTIPLGSAETPRKRPGS